MSFRAKRGNINKSPIVILRPSLVKDEESRGGAELNPLVNHSVLDTESRPNPTELQLPFDNITKPFAKEFASYAMICSNWRQNPLDSH